MIDYHIHTPLCNHAVGTMKEYAEAAVRKGLGGICFLDHLIINGPGRRNSMKPEEIEGYISEIKNLRNNFRGKLEIYAGLEIDFQPEYADIIIDIVSRYPFDAIGSSVHFIEGLNIASRREAASLTPKEEQGLAEAYFDRMASMLDYDYYDIVCHFDIFKKTGRTIPDFLESRIEEIIDRIAIKEIAVELNTAGWDHPAGECYPGRRIIEKMVRRNIPFVFSSDAHRPEETGRHFNKAAALLSSIGSYKRAFLAGREFSIYSGDSV